MRMLHLVLDGLKGRKRDTAVLGGILLLAFLFLTLSSILLSSFAATSQRQRQALHGDWQVLYYGAGEEAAARCAQVARSGKIELVGTIDSGRLIGTIDEAVQELGRLELLEGRLPQGRDEILLVRGRMPAEPAVGEKLNVAYVYDYMRGGTASERMGNRDAILDSARQTMTEQDWESFRTYLREHYHPDKNTVTFPESFIEYWYGGYDEPEEPSKWDYPLPEGYDLERMLAELEDELLYYWVSYIYGPETFGYGAYITNDTQVNLGGLKGFEDFTINVRSQGFRTDYTGKGFTDEVREKYKDAGTQTSETMIYKGYTVVGYVAPYADHWDVRGCAMPDAFVAPEAGEAQLQALRYAEEFYYEGAPTFDPTAILLLWTPEGTPLQMAEQILPIYQEAQEPYFRLEAMVDDLMGTTKGVITGLDPATGEEKSCQIQQYEGSFAKYVIQMPNGNWRQISGDPSAPERWHEFSDILLPLQPAELTAQQLERENIYPLRLNNYSYPPAGDAESSLQLLCSGVLVGVAACSVFQVFWVQLRRRKMRLSTLMSIGATDGQVLGMLLLEVLVLLAASCVAGIVLGVGLAALVTALTGARFTVELPHLLSGLLCCVAAVFVSALIPMLLVIRIPLTGREQVSRRTLRLRTPRRTARQSYGRILLRQMEVNRGRTALQLVLAWLLALIGLLTVFLCHGAYGGYRRSVTDAAMPDYEIVAPYGMGLTYMKNNLEQAEELRQGSRVSVTVEAPNIWLHCDELLEKSPIVRALWDTPQAESLFGRAGVDDIIRRLFPLQGVEVAVSTEIMGDMAITTEENTLKVTVKSDQIWQEMLEGNPALRALWEAKQSVNVDDYIRALYAQYGFIGEIYVVEDLGSALGDMYVFARYGTIIINVSGPEVWERVLEENPILRELWETSLTEDLWSWPSWDFPLDDIIAKHDNAPPADESGEEAREGEPDKVVNALAVRVVGAYPDSDLLDRLLAMTPEGAVDREALMRGEECILLVPRYMAEGEGVRRQTPDQTVLDNLRADEMAGYLLELHYNERYRTVCREDTAIQAGDTITLTAFRQNFTENSKTESAVTLQPRVAAVITTLDEGLWPLSDNNGAYVVVSGADLVNRLYSASGTRMTADQARWHRAMAKVYYPDCYGLTRFNVYNLPGADPVTQDTAAARFAEDLGLDFHNRRMQIERELSAAQKKLMLFLLLGAEMSLVVLTLLYSAAGMAVEQDRYRLGALQALGVTERQMNRGQTVQALCVALAACVAANVVMVLVQAAAAVMSAYPRLTLLENINGYPWGIHVLVCLAFIAGYTLLQSLPIRRISKLDPIDNIRS